MLVHGGGNDWHEWKKNLAFLARSFQVYALDLPGFGLSQAPDSTVSLYWIRDFLKNFLDRLGIINVNLIGHSLGAMISIVFAAHYPQSVRKLVLVDSSGLGQLSRKGLVMVSLFRRIDRWLGKNRGPKNLAGSAEEWQVLDDLPKIKPPVLIAWGQNDPYLPADQSRLAHNLIPGSSLRIFPHGGHAPQRACPAEFNDMVMQFLSE